MSCLPLSKSLRLKCLFILVIGFGFITRGGCLDAVTLPPEKSSYFSHNNSIITERFAMLKERDGRSAQMPIYVMRKAYAQSDTAALEGMDYLRESTLSIVDQIDNPSPVSECSDKDFDGIPQITHRMWLTFTHAPIEPPATLIEYYLKSISCLNHEKGWRHIFWCWDKTLIPATCGMIESAGLGIEIKELSHGDVYDRMFARHLVLAAMDHGLFTVAGNILRNYVLYLMGAYIRILALNSTKAPCHFCEIVTLLPICD